MATYTADQLKGQGTAGENLSLTSIHTFNFTNPGDSSYFFMESNRNNNGNYNTIGGTFGTPCTNGTWTDNSVGGLVYDKYIMGCVVPPGTSSISFVSAGPFVLSTRYKFRGTGTFSMSSSFSPL